MGSKPRIANMSNAFNLMDTMSVGDILGKNPKKKVRKAMDAAVDPAHKILKTSSTVAVVPTQVASASTASADVFGSRSW
jgi:hypothetical protein